MHRSRKKAKKKCRILTKFQNPRAYEVYNPRTGKVGPKKSVKAEIIKLRDAMREPGQPWCFRVVRIPSPFIPWKHISTQALKPIPKMFAS